ncbi:dioxygenase family protein [Pararhodobacter sp.]|uniref:dioxygenase family protein n=1 Tax=Pararhodobacter sp. TaxID=2127056 RepID=UPI002FDF04FB
MIIRDPDMVTEAALAAVARASDQRHAEIMSALVRHLHAFLRDVRLTDAELETAFDFANRIGQATTDSHNEAALFSDVLGASTLVCLLNNGMTGPTETGAALLGPFWRLNAPEMENGASLLRSPTPGTPLDVSGQVRDARGAPIEGVRVDVWHASPVGLYESQDPEQADMNLRGVFKTDADGRFQFHTVRPLGYPVPTDGPTGEVLRAQRRQPNRPAHLHFLLYREGFRTLITQVFPDDDPHLAEDPVFGVTPALIGDFVVSGRGTPDERCALMCNFTLEAGTARLPTPPIK